MKKGTVFAGLSKTSSLFTTTGHPLYLPSVNWRRYASQRLSIDRIPSAPQSIQAIRGTDTVFCYPFLEHIDQPESRFSRSQNSQCVHGLLSFISYQLLFLPIELSLVALHLPNQDTNQSAAVVSPNVYGSCGQIIPTHILLFTTKGITSNGVM